MAQAPTCFVSQDQVIDQPPAKQLPSIPQATDLPSALAALNAIRQILNAMNNQTQQGGQQGPRGAAGKPGKKEKSRWVEISRATEKIKVPIIDTGDKPFVEVERINRFTMQDTVTGTEFTWNRNSGAT